MKDRISVFTSMRDVNNWLANWGSEITVIRIEHNSFFKITNANYAEGEMVYTYMVHYWDIKKEDS